MVGIPRMGKREAIAPRNLGVVGIPRFWPRKPEASGLKVLHAKGAEPG